MDVFKDDETNPYFGHTLERSYMVLWGCEDTAVAEKCTEWVLMMSSRWKDQPGWRDGSHLGICKR